MLCSLVAELFSWFVEGAKENKDGSYIKNDEKKDAGVKERKDELSSPRQASQQSKARAVPTENVCSSLQRIFPAVC